MDGADRLKFLHGLLTCDVADLVPGRGRWGLALTKPGKIVAEVWIVASDEACFIGTPAGTVDSLYDWLDGFVVMDDVNLADESDTFAWTALHGAGAAETAAELVAGEDAAGRWSFGSIDWTGRGGAAIVGPRESVAALRGAAATRGFAEDPAQWARLRIESLVPEFGVDYDGTRNPHEASLDQRAVSWSKGCYVGQEAVYMQGKRGKVKRRLVAARLADARAVPGDPVTDDGTGEEVGAVTSVAPGGEAAGALAMLSVRGSHASPGARLRVGEALAEVVALPPS